MKLGFVSSILDGWSFETVIETAAGMGFQCVEAACWPDKRAERRYAGVCHIDVDNTSPEYTSHILEVCHKNNVTLSALAYYPNTMDGDRQKREAAVRHLEKVIACSQRLGVKMVTTFVGRDQEKGIEENLELFQQVWPAVIRYAEERQVRIAVENCPMLFDREQWPGGQNLFTTPALWREMFRMIPSQNFGINYDPSHFVWQMMDYIKPVYEFKDRIFHVHFKDIKLYRHKLDEVGIMACPLQYMAPKLPGLGDVDLGGFVSALTDIDYQGYACIEVEDRAFESGKERILDSLRLSKRYMEQFVI